MKNLNFPLIKYTVPHDTKDPLNVYRHFGFIHGETFREAIKELVEIRKELMLKKNPKLAIKLDDLAHKQFVASEKFAPHLARELEAIAMGANLTLTDLVILNNYTDFRDIILPDEGCSTIHSQNEKEALTGQTWDMHRSAKNYLCLLDIPKTELNPPMVVLSLVGCLGLMGLNTHNCLIGVNNINTTNARTGVIWPILVRKVLEKNTLYDMRETLLDCHVTSGHNYLISSPEGGEHWEVTPTISERVGMVTSGHFGSTFHTNHCLGEEIKKIEDQSSMSSTTHARFNLMKRKISTIKDLNTLKGLLTDHEEFPKSICSHFENGAQDPSFTCGGGVADLKKSTAVFWRGCPVHDKDYIEYTVKSDGHSFTIGKTL